MAASHAIVQASQVVETGEIDPEIVVTPGIFVKKVVEIANPVSENQLIRENRRYPWA
jgi:3-oxoadipate CoA-transferase alpha subunit